MVGCSLCVAAYAMALLAGLAAIAVLVSRLRPRRDRRGRRAVTVMVLGDFGRSPRMQYHCISLGKLPNTVVDVVGYGGAAPVAEIVDNPETFRLHMMRPPPALPKSAPRVVFLAYAPFKVVGQVLQMLWTMTVSVGRPTHILVQNPPSIPALPVAVVVAMVHGARLVVDWHNYGYTILGLTVGPTHWLTRVARLIEASFGPMGSDHFCVTDAMREDLRANWGVRATTLHDRPPPFFRPTPRAEVGSLFGRVAGLGCSFDGACELPDGSTVMTDAAGELRPDRPALLVSSTSWTPDEDFGVLFEALQRYEEARDREPRDLPRLLCVITGKGPLKQHYEGLIAKRNLQHVKVVTAWLEVADYPRLLGSATLGVSLHTSSSGLDLPMKVVDMFGCGLPVAAMRFACIGELVQDGRNGVTFATSDELAQQIVRLLRGFPHKTEELDGFRKGLAHFRDHGWDRNWTEAAAPTFAE